MDDTILSGEGASCKRYLDRSAMAKEQLDVRLSLLENGFSPLPAQEKRVLLKGWPKVVATEEMIRKDWSGLNYTTTAIRIEGDLVAVDVDVNDEEMSEKLEDLLYELVPEAYDAPLRTGKGSKFMILARTDKPFGIMNSKVMYDPDGGIHRVEVFSGQTTRYFTCFGPHTIDKSDEVDCQPLIAVEYNWPERETSPINMHRDELPVLSRDALLKFCLTATELMAAAGWKPSEKSAQGVITETNVSDLTNDMQFYCNDDVVRTLENLHEHDGGRCSASWHEEGATNTSRCAVVVDTDDGVVKVLDYDECVWHFPADYRKRTGAEKAGEHAKAASSTLGDMLNQMRANKPELFDRDDDQPQGEHPDDETFTEDEAFQAVVDQMVEEYVHFPSGSASEAVVCIAGRLQGESLSLQSFRDMYARHSFESVGEKGGITKINPVSVWLKDRRVEGNIISGFRFLPEHSTTLAVDEGKVWVNTYKEPVFTEAPAGLQVFHDFMVHLLPDEAEREWFVNWLAYKLQHPTERGAAVVMTSNGAQGTGRGTLYDIIREVVGHQFVKTVSASKLLGKGGQSQFQDWKVDALFNVCNEIFGEITSYREGKAAYEHLKEATEPGVQRTHVTIKGKSDRMIRQMSSVIIATNHSDALPIDAEDRRLAVLTTPKKLVHDARLFEAIEGQRAAVGFRDSFAAAVREYLLSIPTIKADFLFPLMTEAKLDMVDLNEGQIAKYARAVGLATKGDFARVTDFAEVVATTCKRHGLSEAVVNSVPREVPVMLSNQAGIGGWRKMAIRGKLKHGQRITLCYNMDNFEDEAHASASFQTLTMDERAAELVMPQQGSITA